MATCTSCGARFNEDKAAEKFDKHFSGETEYIDYPDNGYHCANCAIANTEIAIENGKLMMEYAASDAEEDDSVPECVSWCGHPNYPMCMDSCKLHED